MEIGMSATSEARKLRLGLVAAEHHRKSWRRQLLCGSFQLSCCQICPVTTRGFHKLSTDRFDPRNWPNKISKLQQKFELDNQWFWAAKKMTELRWSWLKKLLQTIFVTLLHESCHFDRLKLVSSIDIVIDIFNCSLVWHFGTPSSYKGW